VLKAENERLWAHGGAPGAARGGGTRTDASQSRKVFRAIARAESPSSVFRGRGCVQVCQAFVSVCPDDLLS
jgi:hypothetical protein